jgi:serine/threonine protein phosphatase PrpC
MPTSDQYPLHRITDEHIEIETQPYALRLDEHILLLVDPRIDLTPEQRRNLNPSIDCLVYDPQTFDSEKGMGFKALRDGERVVLGRESDFGRFNFSNKISRRHVRLTRTGSEVLVEDLSSANGTFIGRAVVSRETETAQVKPENEFGYEPSSFAAQVHSIASERHPERNEDAAFVATEKPAAGVFDGVGSREGSGLASVIASESIQKSLNSLPTELPIGLAMLALKGVLQTAHREILNTDTGVDIATTATIAKFFKNVDGQPYAAVANVADSRAYLYRNGELSFITLDCGYEIFSAPEDVQKLQDTLARVVDLSKLEERELYAFMRRQNVNTALGTRENPQISATHVLLEPGDRLVLTTDGIHDNLTIDEMKACLTDMGPGNQTYLLVARAAIRSREGHVRSKADDMTAAVLTYEG